MTRRMIGAVLTVLVALTATAGAQVDLPALRARATAGDADAQFFLGAMHASGEGVAKDDAQAAAWYRKAADQGDARAQFSLGWMYSLGQGVPKDVAAALMWCGLAAIRATGKDQKTYAAGRDFIARTSTADQVAEAQRLVKAWQVAFETRRNR